MGDRFADLGPLYELMNAVARAGSIDDVYRQALRTVRLALGADRASLLVCDEEGVMRFRAWQGLSDEYRAATEGHSPWDPDEQGPLPVVIEDVAQSTDLGELQASVVAEGIAALAFIPLVASNRLLGKFMLYYDRRHTFSEAELRLARAIAANVAATIARRDVEAQLRASRDQIEAVLASVADGITVLDRKGRLLFANDAAARLCGFDSVGEMLATPTDGIMERFELLDEDGSRLPEGALPGRRVLAGEPYAETVLRYRQRGSRRERWSSVKAMPVRDEHGHAHLAVSVFRDITRERQAADRSAALAARNASLHAAEQVARREAERAARVLTRLERIQRVALRSSSLDLLLTNVLEAVHESVDSDRATILLLDKSDVLVVRAAIGIDEATARGVQVPLGDGVAGSIAATRRPRVIDDLTQVEALSPYLRRGGSLAGVPLLFSDRLLGVLHVSSDRTAAFRAEDLDFLQVAAGHVAIAIEQTSLFERERDIAAALQQSLLPERFVGLPGVAVAATYLPSTDGTRVGGDWYDAFSLGDGRLVVAVGDVVGHGIEAAGAMGQVRNALRAYAFEDASPARLFNRLNKLLVATYARDFCTAFCAILDPWAGTLTYANAGHPPVLVRDASGDTRFLDAAGSLPLGVVADVSYDEATDTLDPGALLLAYTDGLVERRDEPLDSRLGLLARCLAGSVATPVRQLPDVITAALLDENAPRRDDVAIIAIQLASSNRLSVRVPAEPPSLVIIRRALDGFLTRAGGTPDEIFDLKVACGEACANVVEHAYGTQRGFIRLNGSRSEDGVAITVRDHGSGMSSERRPKREKGRGLALMRALVDDLEIRPHPQVGTEVTIRRRLTGT
jgi:PAS domain S-box-containing protein